MISKGDIIKFMINYPYQYNHREKVSSYLKTYDPGLLKKFYYEMLRIRLIEETIANQYHEDQMKTPIHLVIGQEATAVGACQAVEKTDYAFCGHRTHGCYLAKGGDLKSMLAEFFCRKTGCAGSRGGSMHLLDKTVGMMGSSAIVAGIIPIATGAALAHSLRKEDRIVLTFLGDAAVEEGSFWESLNFAILKRLPIIYFCENNYYSVCSPLFKRQPAHIPIHQKAAGFGATVYNIDGNNVLEVYRTVQEAKKHIHQHRNPVFIEAHTYRYRSHHGPNEDTGYRTLEEIAHWKERDPIQIFHGILTQENLLTQNEIETWKLNIQKELSEALKFAEQSPNPTQEDLMSHVYSE